LIEAQQAMEKVLEKIILSDMTKDLAKKAENNIN